MPEARRAQRRSAAGKALAIPKWLSLYDDFITKNAGQVGQIESALRSLTYIIPGRFRDAEIASESIHSGVQLLSLYHDALLSRAPSRSPAPPPRTAHARYTRFWSQKSTLYRRIATVLQMVCYTELLCEMAAKRKGGEKTRWKVVVAIEAVKAVCRLLLLRVTRSRPLVTPALPERVPVPEADLEDDEVAAADKSRRLYDRSWEMPRTGMTLPALPDPGDISAYLVGRVLTADDVKPADKLLHRLHGPSQVAEVLHILAPLAYAVALAKGGRNRKSWVPWLAGLAVEYAARKLRDRSVRTTALEREEWNRRALAMAWWIMRGAFYENITKGVVGSVRGRMPGFVAGILEDYEYLWGNYYFSTSA